MESKARITALGAYVPPKKLTNHDLENMVETSDEWIVQRTGIKERRITEADVFASDLAVEAVRDLVRRSGKTIDDVDMVVTATFTADYLTPSVSAVVHGKLKLKTSCGVLDVNAACAGFVHALHLASASITAGMCRKILVIGAEALSKIVDYNDRNTCVLFGDGAAAVLVERDETEIGFLGFSFGADGKSADKLYCTGLNKSMNGQLLPIEGFLWQDGRAVYNYTIKTVPQGMKALCKDAGIDIAGVDWFVPHSANLRMIESVCEKIPFPIDKTLISLDRYGNTSSASIPLALAVALDAGKLVPGQLCALYGFGGGLNHAGVIVKW
jgi:3-oxoacyl-[acyl-carrier-protein] synthase-3